MKKMLALVIMMTMVFSLAACGDNSQGDKEKDEKTSDSGYVEGGDVEHTASDDLSMVMSNGKLVIGITIYEPMNYRDNDGKLVGFDTEYAEAVCAKLGVQPEFVEINWDTKVAELDSRSIDCIWNGMTMTEELAQNISFSDPYIKNMQVLIVKKDNADKYTSTESLSKGNVAAEAGSAGEAAIKDNADLSKATYISVGKQTDALMEVKAGTSDAAVLDYVLAAAMVGEGTDYSDLCMVKDVELSVEEYAIGFRKQSNLTDKINEITKELIADGTMAKLAEKYDLSLQLIANQK